MPLQIVRSSIGPKPPQPDEDEEDLEHSVRHARMDDLFVEPLSSHGANEALRKSVQPVEEISLYKVIEERKGSDPNLSLSSRRQPLAPTGKGPTTHSPRKRILVGSEQLKQLQNIEENQMDIKELMKNVQRAVNQDFQQIHGQLDNQLSSMRQVIRQNRIASNTLAASSSENQRKAYIQASYDRCRIVQAKPMRIAEFTIPHSDLEIVEWALQFTARSSAAELESDLFRLEAEVRQALQENSATDSSEDESSEQSRAAAATTTATAASIAAAPLPQNQSGHAADKQNQKPAPEKDVAARLKMDLDKLDQSLYLEMLKRMGRGNRRSSTNGHGKRSLITFVSNMSIDRSSSIGGRNASAEKPRRSSIGMLLRSDQQQLELVRKQTLIPSAITSAHILAQAGPHPKRRQSRSKAKTSPKRSPSLKTRTGAMPPAASESKELATQRVPFAPSQPSTKTGRPSRGIAGKGGDGRPPLTTASSKKVGQMEEKAQDEGEGGEEPDGEDEGEDEENEESDEDDEEDEEERDERVAVEAEKAAKQAEGGISTLEVSGLPRLCPRALREDRHRKLALLESVSDELQQCHDRANTASAAVQTAMRLVGDPFGPQVHTPQATRFYFVSPVSTLAHRDETVDHSEYCRAMPYHEQERRHLAQHRRQRGQSRLTSSEVYESFHNKDIHPQLCEVARRLEVESQAVAITRRARAVMDNSLATVKDLCQEMADRCVQDMEGLVRVHQQAIQEHELRDRHALAAMEERSFQLPTALVHRQERLAAVDDELTARLEYGQARAGRCAKGVDRPGMGDAKRANKDDIPALSAITARASPGIFLTQPSSLGTACPPTRPTSSRGSSPRSELLSSKPRLESFAPRPTSPARSNTPKIAARSQCSSKESPSVPNGTDLAHNYARYLDRVQQDETKAKAMAQHENIFRKTWFLQLLRKIKTQRKRYADIPANLLVLLGAMKQLILMDVSLTSEIIWLLVDRTIRAEEFKSNLVCMALLYMFEPVHWSCEDVFDELTRRGIEPSPKMVMTVRKARRGKRSLSFNKTVDARAPDSENRTSRLHSFVTPAQNADLQDSPGREAEMLAAPAESPVRDLAVSGGRAGWKGAEMGEENGDENQEDELEAAEESDRFDTYANLSARAQSMRIRGLGPQV